MAIARRRKTRVAFRRHSHPSPSHFSKSSSMSFCMDEANRIVASAIAKRASHGRKRPISLYQRECKCRPKALIHRTVVSDRMVESRKSPRATKNQVISIGLNKYSLYDVLTVSPHIDKWLKNIIYLKVGMHRSQEQICKIRIQKQRKNLAFCALRPHIDAVR